MKYAIAFFFLAITLSCNSKKEVYHIPAFSKDNILQAVVEIPAGTNKKFEYNTKTLTFEIDQYQGRDRIIKYLPYPGNYGFIPSTYSNPDQGGDGDALDVIILSESLPTGTVASIIPIGLLKLIDNGEYDYKIIAIPSDRKLQTIASVDFLNFQKKYPNAKEILELWFTSYDKKDSLYIEGWGNEKEALIEINKSLSK